LETWQRKSDARFCYDCLLPGHIAADCTTDKGQAAALRFILEWLTRTHEAVLSKPGFMGQIVVLCHRTRARLFKRSSRDKNPSPLLNDDAFLPFQGKGVDTSASSVLTAQNANDFVQSPFVTEFVPVEFEDVEFRDVAETGRHLGVCLDDPEKVARVARASAAGTPPNLSELMNTAPVCDTVQTSPRVPLSQ
jgi:hypothetical protein